MKTLFVLVFFLAFGANVNVRLWCLGKGDLFSFPDLLVELDLREDSVILLLLLSVKALGSCDCSLDKDWSSEPWVECVCDGCFDIWKFDFFPFNSNDWDDIGDDIGATDFDFSIAALLLEFSHSSVSHLMV